MKKSFRSTLIFLLLLTAFSFIEDKKIVCGTWTAQVYGDNGERRTGTDTLQVKRNGKFVLKKFSTISLPGIYTGHWKIENDSLVLSAESGGMLLLDEKGRPVTEKLKEKKTIKLSIIIHSRNEMYLALDKYSFSRVVPQHKTD